MRTKLKGKFILKTIIDVLVGSLVSIGIFLSPTFVAENKMAYIMIGIIFLLIIVLLIIYNNKYFDLKFLFSLISSFVISLLVVLMIGISLEVDLELIFVVWLIAIPSVILIDAILD